MIEGRRAALAGFAALSLAVLAGFVAYPTEPNYDSVYSLLWAREILDGVAPSLDAYRAPTQHPLALLVSIVLVAVGAAPAQAYVALTLVAFVALVAGVVRLGAVSFGVVAGIVAAALLLTRLNFAFLAAFGYIDIPYLALLVWAGALVARDVMADVRRNRPVVWLLLVTAGLLRPEGWAFAALYAAWGWRGAGRRGHVQALAMVAAAPLLWALSDLMLTGDPLFSWTYTTGSASRLGRNHGLEYLPEATLRSARENVKAPVLALAIVGMALALWREPRRAAVPFALTAGGVATFAVISAQGFSVIPRYFAAAAVGLFLFAGHALGGWELLPRDAPARRRWMIGAAVAAVAGGAFVATTLNPAKVDADLRLRERVYANVDAVLASPAVRAGRRCGPISLPNHKLVPYVRWHLRLGRADVIARSDVAEGGRARRGGVAIVVRDVPVLRSHPAFGPRSVLDPLTIIPAPPGFTRVASTPAITAWTRCPPGRAGQQSSDSR